MSSISRRAVAALAAEAVAETRSVYLSVPNDAVRVAALVEIAAAAAALARTIVKLRHLDPDLIAPHVKDPMDLRAVLVRGRWLPTMTRHVAIPAKDRAALDALTAPAVVEIGRRRTRHAGQPSLFDTTAGEG